MPTKSRRHSQRWLRRAILFSSLLVAYVTTCSYMLSTSTIMIIPSTTRKVLPIRARRLEHKDCSRRGSNIDLLIQPPSVPGIVGQPCQYEGHCGVGTTCIVTDGRRTCQNYFNKDDDAMTVTISSHHQACASACIAALTESLPKQHQLVVQSVQQTRNKDVIPGCVIRYRRTTSTNTTNSTTGSDDNYHYDPPDYYAKLALRNKIVRVDPVLTTAPSSATATGEWMALCNNPCNSNSTCSKGFICKEEVCQRDSESNANELDHRHEMVIVTGANKQYFYGLLNLAGSIRYWAPKCKLVVYNLGMTEEHLKEVESWGNVLEIKWRNGIPESLPEHLNSPKVYAWKPIALNESLHQYKQIMWLDAGSTVIAPIDDVIQITQKTGIFLVQGQDDSMILSHPCTYAALGPYNKKTFDGGPHYSGNTQAYLLPSRYVDTVVIPNAKCALEPECIMPTGSSLKNHRYDQTTLSILSYRHDLRIPEYSKYIAASRPKRNSLKDKMMTPDNDAPVVWTSRGTCTDFYHLMVESPWQQHLAHVQRLRNRKVRNRPDLKASCLRVMSPEDCKGVM